MKTIKSIFAVVLVGLVALGSVQAQDAKPGKGNGRQAKEWSPPAGANFDVAKRTEKALKHLTKQLSLTADQSTKTKAILESRFSAIKAAYDKAAADKDRKAFNTARKDALTKFDADFKGLLTADQATKYEALKQKMRERAKAKMQENSKGAKPGKSPEDVETGLEDND